MSEEKGAPMPIHFVRETYIQKLIAHGLTPLFVSPAMPEAMIDELYAEADGVLLTGGSDINPDIYGAARHPKTEPGDIRRDTCEIRLTKKAIADRKPFLGICRGHQILTIATGGTLIQHLPDLYPNELHADVTSYYDMLKPSNGHPVKIVAGSKTDALIKKPEIFVTSAHHQATEKVGSGLRIAATSPAGVIEIIEHTDPGYFCFGIQSHPECCAATATDGVDKSGLEVFFTEFAKAVQ